MSDYDDEVLDELGDDTFATLAEMFIDLIKTSNPALASLLVYDPETKDFKEAAFSFAWACYLGGYAHAGQMMSASKH